MRAAFYLFWTSARESHAISMERPFFCEVEEKPLPPVNKIVGIDLGLNTFAMLSSGQDIQCHRCHVLGECLYFAFNRALKYDLHRDDFGKEQTMFEKSRMIQNVKFWLCFMRWSMRKESCIIIGSAEYPFFSIDVVRSSPQLSLRAGIIEKNSPYYEWLFPPSILGAAGTA